MRTFKYRWKAGDNEFVGTRDAEDRDSLKTLISQTGGELVEVLEEAVVEKGKEGGGGTIGKKRCPFCAESIQADAIKCKHCGEMLDKKNRSKKEKEKKAPRNRRGLIECPFCHSEIKPKSRGNSLTDVFITLILLLCYVVPGIIYAMWVSGKKVCPECRMKLG